MTIVINSRSDSKAAREDLAKLNKSVENIGASVNKATDSFSNMASTFAKVLTGVSIVTFLAKQSDSLTNYRNKLKIVSDTQEEFLTSFRELKNIAFRSANDLESVSSLYNRIAISGKKAGASQRELLTITETVGQALKLSGASAQEANSALVQFGQAIASGRLAGDELRSILENAPVLAMGIADSLGVSVGRLRELGEQGQLSVQKILLAVLDSSDTINERMSQLAPTYAAALKRLGLGFKELFANVVEGLFGTTSVIASFINNIAFKVKTFAENVKYYIYVIQTEITFATIAMSGLFSTAMDVSLGVIATVASLSAGVGGLVYNSVAAFISNIPNLYNQATNYISTLFSSLRTKFSTFTTEVDFGKFLFGSYVRARDSIVSFITGVFSRIKEIKVMDYFPGLTAAYEFVSKWVRNVNSLFAWLWNEVVGNSWIPDLVIGVTVWMKKLLGPALVFAASFTNGVSAMFATTLKAVASFFVIGELVGYKKVLFSILGIFTSIAAVASMLDLGPIIDKIKGVVTIEGGTSGSESQSIFKKILDALTAGFALVSDSVKFLYKKLTGTAGEGEEAPWQGLVGSLQSVLMGAGTFLQKAWENTQAQMLTIATGIAATIIIRSGSQLRLVMLSLLTAVWAGIINDSTALSSRLVDTFSDAIRGLMSFIVGENIFGEFKRSMLGFILALTLFSSSFRSAIGSAAAGVVSAPSRVGTMAGSAYELRVAQRELDVIRARSDAFNADTRATSEALIRRQQLAENNGMARQAQRIGNDLRNFQLDTDADRKKLDAELKATEKAVSSLRANITAAGDAFKAGILNFTTGLGSVVGGIAGFQAGQRIIDRVNENRAPELKLTSAQEWGITAGTAFAGQAAGSFIGQVVGRLALLLGGAVVAIIGTILTTIISSPILLAVSAIVAVIGLIRLAFTDGGKLFIGAVKNYFSSGEFIDDIFNAFKSAFGLVKELKSKVDTDAFNRGRRARAATDEFFGWLTADPANQPYVPKRASGGSISGPGTGTSDSILARLSNGEYVINAKSTAKYRPLIEAINKDMLPGFSGGGMWGITPNKQYKTAGMLGPNIAPITEGENELITIGERILALLADGLSKIGNFFTGGSSSQEVETGTSLENANNIVAVLKDLNFNSIGVEDISELARTMPDTFDQMVNVLNNVTRAQDVMLDQPDTLNADRAFGIIQNSANQLNDIFKNLIRTMNFGGLRDLPENFGTFGKQFETISEVFPELGLSFNEFANISEQLRRTMLESSSKLLAQEAAVTEAADTPEGNTLGQVTSLQAAAVELRHQLLDGLTPVLATLRTSFEGLSGRLKSAGLELNAYAFNMLKDFEVNELASNLAKLETEQAKLTKSLENTELGAAERATAQAAVDRIREAIDFIITEAGSRSTNEFGALSGTLARYGIELGSRLFNRLDTAQKEALAASLARLENARIALAPGNTLTDAERRAAQDVIDQGSQAIADTLAYASITLFDRMVAAGSDFASSVEQGFSQGISNLLKAKKNDDDTVLQTFAKDIMQSLSNSVIDTFAQGLTDSIFTPEVEGKLKDLGGNILKAGSDLLSSLFDSIANGMSGLFEAGSGLLGSVLGGLGAALGVGSGFVGPLPKAATGGLIAGVGTGTSDSNLVRLSKGEYVINAKETKKNLALVEAINNGKLSRFATGGMVGDTAMSGPALALGGSTTFNVQITGDISRQTRKEMIQMMPQLASGVNSYNREKGYRG